MDDGANESESNTTRPAAQKPAAPRICFSLFWTFCRDTSHHRVPSTIVDSSASGPWTDPRITRLLEWLEEGNTLDTVTNERTLKNPVALGAYVSGRSPPEFDAVEIARTLIHLRTRLSTSRYSKDPNFLRSPRLGLRTGFGSSVPDSILPCSL